MRDDVRPLAKERSPPEQQLHSVQGHARSGESARRGRQSVDGHAHCVGGHQERKHEGQPRGFAHDIVNPVQPPLQHALGNPHAWDSSAPVSSTPHFVADTPCPF